MDYKLPGLEWYAKMLKRGSWLALFMAGVFLPLFALVVAYVSETWTYKAPSLFVVLYCGVAWLHSISDFRFELNQWLIRFAADVTKPDCKLGYLDIAGYRRISIEEMVKYLGEIAGEEPVSDFQIRRFGRRVVKSFEYFYRRLIIPFCDSKEIREKIDEYLENVKEKRKIWEKIK